MKRDRNGCVIQLVVPLHSDHPVPVQSCPLCTRPVHSSIMPANLPTVTWPPPNLLPLPWGLPVPHNCVSLGNFKLVASIQAAISICYSAVRSTKPPPQPAPRKQQFLGGGTIVMSGRRLLDEVTKGNGAENAGAACAPHSLPSSPQTQTTD